MKNPAAQQLGSLGRAKNTPAQQEASRRNGQKSREDGKKGGRPKKPARADS